MKFGRKPKLEVATHQREEAIARKQVGEALVDIAKSYNVSHKTISRLNVGDELDIRGGLAKIKPMTISC